MSQNRSKIHPRTTKHYKEEKLTSIKVNKENNKILF